MSNSLRAIETRYAGYHFRSRLEARWAVFFDALGIRWEYEPQGYEFPNGRRYLPDFLLTDCGTFIEVRGDNARVDMDELAYLSRHLPEMPLGTNEYTRGEVVTRWPAERGPRLMLLGPIPDVSGVGDPGWMGLHGDSTDDECGAGSYGFALFRKNKRPWWLDGWNTTLDPLKPQWCDYEPNYAHGAYVAARSARFEHGHSGAS